MKWHKLLTFVGKTMYGKKNGSQVSINGVGLTKHLNTSLKPTSKHSSHLRSLARVVGRGEVCITVFNQPLLLGRPALYKKFKQQTF